MSEPNLIHQGTAEEVASLQAQIKALTEKRSGLVTSGGNESPTPANNETDLAPASPTVASTKPDTGAAEELKRLKYSIVQIQPKPLRTAQYEKDAQIQKLTVEKEERIQEIAQLKQSLKAKEKVSEGDLKNEVEKLKAEVEQAKTTISGLGRGFDIATR